MFLMGVAALWLNSCWVGQKVRVCVCVCLMVTVKHTKALKTSHFLCGVKDNNSQLNVSIFRFV